MNRPEKTSNEFVIQVSDIVLKSIGSYQEFNIDDVLDDFDYLDKKYDNLLSGDDIMSIQQSPFTGRKNFQIITKFMLDNGYISNAKDIASGSVKDSLYVLTNEGRLCKIIGGHLKYSKYLTKQQNALIKHPAFLYLTRHIAFIISGVSLLASLSIGIYSTYKSKSDDDKYKAIQKQVIELQKQVELFRMLGVPNLEHQASDTTQVSKGRQ